MKLSNITAAVALVLAAPFASATVLTFDDLSGHGAMVNGYGGFDWTQWTHYDFVQPPYTAASTPTRLYYTGNNGIGNAISSASAFTFQGAYFAGQSTTISFDMYLGGNLVATSGSLAVSALPTFLSSGYSGSIDKIVVSSNNNLFVMDNLTVNAVPEPETYAMLLAGLGVMGAMARRRKTKQA